MQRSWWIVGALSAVLFIPGGASAQSKPANLPANQQIECPDCQESVRGKFSIEIDITSSGITLKVGAGTPAPSDAPAIDTVSPTLVPMYLEQLLKQLGSVLVPTNAALGRTVIGKTDGRADQARQFFDVGEIYRRLGLYSSARFYYQRVHSLQPATELGRQAIERLTEIEGRLREAEESGAEDPEMVFRQMRERSMLLGLVELTY